MSPGVQSSSLQIAFNVLNLIAFPFPVLSIDKFAFVIPILSASSEEDIFLFAIITSKFTTIATNLIPFLFAINSTKAAKVDLCSCQLSFQLYSGNLRGDKDYIFLLNMIFGETSYLIKVYIVKSFSCLYSVAFFNSSANTYVPSHAIINIAIVIISNIETIKKMPII